MEPRGEEFTSINSLNPSEHPYDMLLLPLCRGGNSIREGKSFAQGHTAITETAWIHIIRQSGSRLCALSPPQALSWAY